MIPGSSGAGAGRHCSGFGGIQLLSPTPPNTWGWPGIRDHQQPPALAATLCLAPYLGVGLKLRSERLRKTVRHPPPWPGSLILSRTRGFFECLCLGLADQTLSLREGKALCQSSPNWVSVRSPHSLRLLTASSSHLLAEIIGCDLWVKEAQFNSRPKQHPVSLLVWWPARQSEFLHWPL